MSVPSRKLLTGFNIEDMAISLHGDGVISNDEFQEINEEEDTFDKARALLHILGSKSSSPNSLLLIGAYLRTVSRSGSQRTLDKRNSFRKMGKHSSIYEEPEVVTRKWIMSSAFITAVSLAAAAIAYCFTCDGFIFS